MRQNQGVEHLDQSSGKGKNHPGDKEFQGFAVVLGGVFPIVIVIEYPEEGDNPDQGGEQNQNNDQITLIVPADESRGKVEHKAQDNPRSSHHRLSVVEKLISFHGGKVRGLGEKMKVGVVIGSPFWIRRLDPLHSLASRPFSFPPNPRQHRSEEW